MNKFRRDARFTTWLTRIAVNEGLMMMRKRRPDIVSLGQEIETGEDAKPREVEDWGPSPEQHFAQTELNRILSEVISQLDPGSHAVFVLRRTEQLSVKETAQALGLSVPAVKSRLLRGRLQLCDNFSKYWNPFVDEATQTE